MLVKKMLTSLAILLLLQACSSNSGQVMRIDPRELRDTDANYGSEDLHIFTKSMIQSLLRSKILTSSTPTLILSNIHMGKGIDEHIDTGLIKNSLRNNLLKTKKVHFIDEEYTDNSQHIDYILSGELHAIKKDTPSTIDNFYMLSLKLTDSKSSLLVWTEEKEIRKILIK
jgi:PBP1b-binding outer membrane lipoprotein LpoB